MQTMSVYILGRREVAGSKVDESRRGGLLFLIVLATEFFEAVFNGKVDIVVEVNVH